MATIATTTIPIYEFHLSEYIEMKVSYDGKEFTLSVDGSEVTTFDLIESIDLPAVVIAVTESLISSGAVDSAVTDAVDDAISSYYEEDELREEFAELNEEEEGN